MSDDRKLAFRMEEDRVKRVIRYFWATRLSKPDATDLDKLLASLYGPETLPLGWYAVREISTGRKFCICVADKEQPESYKQSGYEYVKIPNPFGNDLDDVIDRINDLAFSLGMDRETLEDFDSWEDAIDEIKERVTEKVVQS